MKLYEYLQVVNVFEKSCKWSIGAGDLGLKPYVAAQNSSLS